MALEKKVKEKWAIDICNITVKGKIEKGNIDDWVYKKDKDALKLKKNNNSNNNNNNNILKCA